MSCSRCIHFTMRAAADATSEPTKSDLSVIGICRRFPPRMMPRTNHIASLFPNVHRGHTCGEYDSGALAI